MWLKRMCVITRKSFSYNHRNISSDFNWLTGKTVVKMENEFKVGCVTPRPCDPDVFLCGGFSSEVKAWDVRSGKVSLIILDHDWSNVCIWYWLWTVIGQMFVCKEVTLDLWWFIFMTVSKAVCVCARQVLRVYKAGIQQTLDILFLGEGKEFISSTDAVSRDSAELTLVAWDFDTTAKLSNQIFHVWKTPSWILSH